MKDLNAITTLLLLSLISGCTTVDDPGSKMRRQLMLDLREACIEANGGLQMDAIDLYGGRISGNCSAWAHKLAERAYR